MTPRLIHPVEVVITQVVEASTVVDSTLREVVGPAVVRTVSVQGQMREARGRALQWTAGGDSSTANTVGHIVFEIDALAQADGGAGVVLRLGDRITSVAGQETNHRVTRIEDHAAYRGRFWHRWAYFSPEDA